jgi:hypothetical protein
MMTQKEKNLFVKSISEWWCRTGIPFNKADDPLFMAAVKCLRADAPTITRKALSGPLLQNCMTEIVAQKVTATLSAKRCSVTSDGWSNTHGEPIINCTSIQSNGCTLSRKKRRRESDEDNEENEVDFPEGIEG